MTARRIKIQVNDTTWTVVLDDDDSDDGLVLCALFEGGDGVPVAIGTWSPETQVFDNLHTCFGSDVRESFAKIAVMLSDHLRGSPLGPVVDRLPRPGEFGRDKYAWLVPRRELTLRADQRAAWELLHSREHGEALARVDASHLGRYSLCTRCGEIARIDG